MPSVLLHVAALERLSLGAVKLSPELARALSEDIEYARLGAVFADLPQYEGFRGGMGLWLPRGDLPYFSHLFHEKAPVQMGLKMAELVASGALVGREPGLAVLAGYFLHLCLDRVLHPMLEGLVQRQRRPGERAVAAHRRIEWLQALFYLREVWGQDMVGSRALRDRFHLVKRRGLPTRGVGRGIYELLRLSSQETLGDAPSKVQVDGWVRGLYVYGWMLSSPLGRGHGIPPFNTLSFRELFQGDQIDVPKAVDSALARTAEVLGELEHFMARGSFTLRARGRFLAAFPEGPLGQYAA